MTATSRSNRLHTKSLKGILISSSQIWISPIVTNINGSDEAGEAYHGFWTKDITTLNSHFGTANDLKELSQALHDRDMVWP